jgi:phospho-N-acetylmuramoyl-pentapeptide-transferase
MGGIMFIFGIAVSIVVVGLSELKSGEPGHIYVFVLALLCAAIGFVDDYKKLKQKQNLGLTAKKKFALHVLAAALFLVIMRIEGYLSTDFYIPFVNVTLYLPAPVYYVISAFIIVGTVNAVNITDGADGLATGVSIPVALCYVFIAALWGYTALGISAAALAGALVAFLFFNFRPAKIFMGDTGAQFLGGAICALAFAMDVPIILIPLGIVYIVETMSDIIQIIYYKRTHGKRVFKMAPLHHHLELCGWSEYKLFAIFTAVSAVFAALSCYGVYFRK